MKARAAVLVLPLLLGGCWETLLDRALLNMAIEAGAGLIGGAIALVAKPRPETAEGRAKAAEADWAKAEAEKAEAEKAGHSVAP